MPRGPFRLLVTLALAGLPLIAAAAPNNDDIDAHGRHFVRRNGRDFHMHGSPLRLAGASNYYLMYKSHAAVDNLLTTADAAGFNVMRLWGALDIGNQDDSNSIRGKAEGVYFHYWDTSAPAFNDGPDGLQHLDYVVYKAGQLGLRVIIPFVNNWNDFGGMDQYVRWRGAQFHDDFYTDPLIRQWYKDWIAHLLNRVNIYTGIAYKDDATIMQWELANEPRCRAYGVYPESGSCNTQTLVDWADDTSRFVKSIDRRHLLSAGDEGFFCTPGATDWTENCGEGVDTLALADLPKIDVMSFHLYPDSWGKTAAWGTEWIKRHIREARHIHERAMLGEFGIKDKSIRNTVYKEWTDTVLLNGGPGALYWMLSDRLDDGSYYPDYDGFTVYCPSPVCTAFSHFADINLLRGPFTFPPVADHDTVETPFGTPITLHATANDITYWNVRLRPDKLDLDPLAPGRQTSSITDAGTFTLLSGGNIAFTPAPDFSGTARASYVVPDDWHRLSNVANLAVVVKPDPNAALKLFSFETGTEGWAPPSWGDTAATVHQSSNYATDGSFSLQVDTVAGGWYGVTLAPTPANVAAKTHFKFDIKTTTSGTSQNAALQVGDGWNWCQGTAWTWTNPDTTATVDLELAALDCGGATPDYTKVQVIYVWFQSGGTFYLDNVRAE
jgi:mannan endo-1,4-beta-mannosidase